MTQNASPSPHAPPPPPPSPSLADRLATPWGVTLILGVLLLWRLGTLFVRDLPISFDEAQYWFWAQSFEFGYFSKPPIVAWVIATTTGLLGDTSAAVKMGSAIAHFGAALVLFFLGRDLYGRHAGLFASVIYGLMPAVSFSSMVITVDPFLLFFWALALWFLSRAILTKETLWWLLLGLALGLGLLAKYAMVFFLLSLAVYMILTQEGRGLVKEKRLWGALALGGVIFSPNVLWNMANGFLTFHHTQANANLGRDMFNPDKALEFFGSQFGVFGPVAFGVLLFIFARSRAFWRDHGDAGRAGRYLICFSLPILALMVAQGFLSRANANWAAPVYMASSVLVAGWVVCGMGQTRYRILLASVVINSLLALTVYHYERVLVLTGHELTAKSDFLLKRARGWDTVGLEVSQVWAAHPKTSLAFDERKLMSSMLFYVKPTPDNAAMWNEDVVVTNHFEMVADMKDRLGDSFVFVTEEPNPNHFASRFASVSLLADIRFQVYEGLTRDVRVYLAQDFQGYNQ